MSDNSYQKYQKYLKYKQKYLNLIKQYGNGRRDLIQIDPKNLDLIKKNIAEYIQQTFGIDPEKILYEEKDGFIKSFYIDSFDKINQLNLLQKIINEENTKLNLNIPNIPNIPDIKKDFLDTIWEYRMDIVHTILDPMSPIEVVYFLENTLAKEDHNKTALYLAARKGNIEFLEYILTKVGPKNMTKLLSILDDEGRTVLMAAVSAVKNQERTFDMILYFTLPELIIHKDHNKRNLYDWFKLRHIENPYITQRINDIFLLLNKGII
jgi:hypothetical protein